MSRAHQKSGNAAAAFEKALELNPELREAYYGLGQVLKETAARKSDFERTERIPVERVQAPGDYVRDSDEWIARCVARVLELDPIIKREEAHRSVSGLAGLERWRLMKPEAAAEQLYAPIRPRS